MKCPICDKEMFLAESEHVTLDTCDSCKGIWFDRSALGHAASTAKFKVPKLSDIVEVKNSKEALRPCPRCGVMMKKGLMFDMPPLIDYCEYGHGLWFDNGELGRYVKGSKAGSGTIIGLLGDIFSSRFTTRFAAIGENFGVKIAKKFSSLGDVLGSDKK